MHICTSIISVPALGLMFSAYMALFRHVIRHQTPSIQALLVHIDNTIVTIEYCLYCIYQALHYIIHYKHYSDTDNTVVTIEYCFILLCSGIMWHLLYGYVVYWVMLRVVVGTGCDCSAVGD
jgi:hypothetical protein